MEDVASIEKVAKVYQKGNAPAVYALRSVTLSIPRGQYIAIMGPSGSGKSTLMNILGCLDRPTSGSYYLAGRDVAQMNDTDLSKARGEHIGFVFQAFNLIPELTVEENVQVPLFYQSVPKAESRSRALETLNLVGLGERLGHRPSELSGGQQQRVAIARALVTRPSILLADEPTGNLDSATGQAILGMFEDLHKKGLTIIMVTHDDSIADRCERVVRLKDGNIDRDDMVLRK
jgi:putative ABC transport system ATP-binding protein